MENVLIQPVNAGAGTSRVAVNNTAANIALMPVNPTRLAGAAIADAVIESVVRGSP